MSLESLSPLYIGLMSGTSLDAIDCALVNFQSGNITLVDFLEAEIPTELKSRILNLCENGQDQVHTIGQVDTELGRLFASTVNSILERNKLSAKDINAIGSHGQTIRHHPPLTENPSLPYTIQLGDPNTISALTGITTVADFRRKDIAIGGQGAPLVPAFHREVFASDKSDRIILNIGGMSNISLIKKGQHAISGFDTGPGNVLLDIWIQKNKGDSFDANGEWAGSGRVDEALLQNFLDDDYFQLPPPKSTGREKFNYDWLKSKLHNYRHLKAEDIQATLLELTTSSVSSSVSSLLNSGEIIICGGGARNSQILHSLKHRLKNFTVCTSSEQGLEADSVEAVAFAWLAQQAMARIPVDYTSITGASHPIIMGGIYYAEPTS